MNKRAVFLDRDGTINEDVGYPGRISQIRIYPYSFEAIRKIRAAGFLAVIMTNQSGIGRGYFTEAALEKIHDFMQAAFHAHKTRADAIYYCPHYALSDIPRYRKNCSCRKPEPGLALRAAHELGINLQRSYMIGDKVEDVLFGINIGATPILVRTGFGASAETALHEMRITPAAVTGNLLDAVNWLLGRDSAQP
jgi:D-glycero-D-manno-heptose 1,7-bisphosphate phosphatase